MSLSAAVVNISASRGLIVRKAIVNEGVELNEEFVVVEINFSTVDGCKDWSSHVVRF
jgi:hypothetical protein